MENSISSDLRTLADAVEAHPLAFSEFTNDHAVITVYNVSVAQVRAMLSAFPQTKITPCPNNAIVYFDLDFGLIELRFVGHHDDFMMPTIEGNKVKWVMRPEIQKELESASA
jgi:hypothetical protein